MKTKAHLSCILILDIFIDSENTEFETSAEVDQHVNENSSENIIQGICLFKEKIYNFFATKHINTYPFLYMVYVNKINLLLQYM